MGLGVLPTRSAGVPSVVSSCPFELATRRRVVTPAPYIVLREATFSSDAVDRNMKCVQQHVRVFRVFRVFG